MGELDSDEEADRDKTTTGLSLLIIGLLIGWIPYIGLLGGLVALVGIYFVWRGRLGFDETHHRNVKVGAVLLVLSQVGSLLLVGGLFSSVVTAAETPGATPQSIAPLLQGDFSSYIVGVVIIAILGVLAQVILVYALNDAAGRKYLLGAFVAAIAVAVVEGALLLQYLSTAIAQSTAGSTFNPTPISELQGQIALVGALAILPNLILAMAHYRARRWILDDLWVSRERGPL